MDWSVDGQTPEFLAATRMVSLDDSIVATILEHVPIRPGMRVLDVGSGSGEYCFRLGSAVEGVSFVGLEYDAGFVEFAGKRASGEVGYPFETPNPANTYEFFNGDGLDLPFDDASFDAVISHTYLTAVPDWACALGEMCRVCKSGGTVSSITSMTDDFFGTGTIGLFTNLIDPQNAALLNAVNAAKTAAFPTMDLISGISPRKVPVSFDWIGLEDVSCTPLAHYFCLSDANTKPAVAKRHIDLLKSMERSQLQRLMDHPVSRKMITDDQWRAYSNLIDVRCEELLSQPENHEWNWYGNTSLLVCGTVRDVGPNPRTAAFRIESRKGMRMLEHCAAAGIAVNVRMTQLGPGRCVKATLSSGDHAVVVAGFDPPRAIIEGCAKLAKDALNADNTAPSELRELVEFETALSHAEGDACGADIAEGVESAFLNEAIYKADDIWEAAAEAALANRRAEFRHVGSAGECQVVGCTIAADGQVSRAIAAHPDVQEAARRSFARALAALS